MAEELGVGMSNQCLMLLEPFVERAPMLPLALVDEIVCDLAKPARLDAVRSMQLDPVTVPILSLQIGERVAVPASKLSHTLVERIHRAGQVDLAHAPSAS